MIAKNSDGGICLTMEAEPEEVSCDVSRMGEIAVYREEQGWQWLWQKTAEVLHLQWDKSGNRVRLFEEKDEEWQGGEFAQVDTDYGSYLFSVTSVKLVPAKDDESEKLYQITWEYENIDFGQNGATHLSIADSALHIVDSDGYVVEHRDEVYEEEASNRDGAVVKAGEKCKAYSVFNVNNEECEYLTVSLDGRDGTTFKVYVED